MPLRVKRLSDSNADVVNSRGWGMEEGTHSPVGVLEPGHATVL